MDNLYKENTSIIQSPTNKNGIILNNQHLIKTGYLYFYKKKTAHGVIKWSKRWCEMDNTYFSYYSHKRNKKPREIISLRECPVLNISNDDEYMEYYNHIVSSPKSTTEYADSLIIIAIIKPDTNQKLVIKADSGWFQALVNANHTPILNDQVKYSLPIVNQNNITNHYTDTYETSIINEKKKKQKHIYENHYEEEEEGNNALFYYQFKYNSEFYLTGSLLRWIMTDIKNFLIIIYLGIIVWLSSMIS